jgi:hypothetical protein
MCKGSREFVDHLLLHCSFMGELSYVVFGAIQLVMPKTVIDVHFSWQGFDKNKNSFLWKGASLEFLFISIESLLLIKTLLGFTL